MLVQINYHPLHNYTYLLFMKIPGLKQGEEFQKTPLQALYFLGQESSQIIINTDMTLPINLHSLYMCRINCFMLFY